MKLPYDVLYRLIILKYMFIYSQIANLGFLKAAFFDWLTEYYARK